MDKRQAEEIGVKLIVSLLVIVCQNSNDFAHAIEGIDAIANDLKDGARKYFEIKQNNN